MPYFYLSVPRIRINLEKVLIYLWEAASKKLLNYIWERVTVFCSEAKKKVTFCYVKQRKRINVACRNFIAKFAGYN